MRRLSVRDSTGWFHETVSFASKVVTSMLIRMKLTHLPRYLILYVTRFVQNNWYSPSQSEMGGIENSPIDFCVKTKFKCE